MVSVPLSVMGAQHDDSLVGHVQACDGTPWWMVVVWRSRLEVLTLDSQDFPVVCHDWGLLLVLSSWLQALTPAPTASLNFPVRGLLWRTLLILRVKRPTLPTVFEPDLLFPGPNREGQGIVRRFRLDEVWSSVCVALSVTFRRSQIVPFDVWFTSNSDCAVLSGWIKLFSWIHSSLLSERVFR